MKKVLALVLAVLMMATVAFAAPDVVPGKKILVTINTTDTEEAAGAAVTSDVVNGNFTVVAKASFDGKKPEFSTKNYSLSNIKWDSGKDYIESIKIDDNENKVVIKLKQDYTLTKAKTVAGSFKVVEKGVGKSKTIAMAATTVGYDVTATPIVDGGAVVPADGALNKFDSGLAYGTMNVTSAGNSTVSVRVYKDEKYYLASDGDANTAVLKAAPEDAEVSFVNFPGTPTFNATATLYLYDADEKSFVYEIKDGKTVKVGKYDEDEGCYIVKARTLGSYVISDKALSASTTTDATTSNPDTGANDVVGIAAALAAVALVSAAAVSLKK